VLEGRVSELEAKNINTSLTERLKALDSRLSSLERKYDDTSSQQINPDKCNLPDEFAARAVRITALERNKRLEYNLRACITSNRCFLCPMATCKITSKRASDLNRHIIRHHSRICSPIVQQVCHPCGQSFESTNSLIKHEKSDHAESFGSRIEPYIPFYRQTHCKLRLISFYSFAQTNRYGSKPEANLLASMSRRMPTI
jgi:hypothetical protein